MAVTALGVGIWMVAVAPQALRLADSPGGWLVALAAGIAGSVVGLWLLDRLAAQRGRSRRAERDAGTMERELVAALAAHGALTPAEAALRTPLTLDEAESLLEALASMGTVRTVDGADGRAYGLAGPVGGTNPVRHDLGTAPAGPVAAEPAPAPQPLSEQELDVLALAATGRTNHEIAGALSLSVEAVRALTEGIARKLGAQTRTEAIVRARMLALL